MKLIAEANDIPNKNPDPYMVYLRIAAGMEKFVFVDNDELTKKAQSCWCIEIAEANTQDGDVYNIIRMYDNKEHPQQYKIARPYGAGFGVLLKCRKFTDEEIKSAVAGTCTQNGETVGDYVVDRNGANRLRPRIYLKVKAD